MVDLLLVVLIANVWMGSEAGSSFGSTSGTSRVSVISSAVAWMICLVTVSSVPNSTWLKRLSWDD